MRHHPLRRPDLARGGRAAARPADAGPAGPGPTTTWTLPLARLHADRGLPAAGRALRIPPRRRRSAGQPGGAARAAGAGCWLGIGKELRAQGFQRVVFLNGHGDHGLASGGADMLDVPFQPQPAAPLAGRPGPAHGVGQHRPHRTARLSPAAEHRHADRPGHRRRAGRRARRARSVCLPAWPYGVSTHTREFPGTLNLGGRVFEDFFLAVIRPAGRAGRRDDLLLQRPRRQPLLPGQRGQAGRRAPPDPLHRHRMAAHHRPGAGALSHERPSAAWATAASWRPATCCTCAPIWCTWNWRPQRPTSSARTTTSWTGSRAASLIANPPWSDDTTSGIYGDGTLGTAEKGRLWLAAAVEEKLEPCASCASSTRCARARGRGGQRAGAMRSAHVSAE